MSDYQDTTSEADSSAKIKSGFLWLLTGAGVQAVMRILFTAVLARLLTPSDFGLLASAMIVIGFADLFSQMGVGPALVQTKELSAEKISSAFTFSIGLGVLLILIFSFINPLIAAFFEMPNLLLILNVLIFLFPIKSFTQLSYSLLQRDFEFKELAGLDVVSYIIGYGGVGISLAYLGYGVWALVYGIFSQSIIYSILLYWLKPHKMSMRVNNTALNELLAFGKGFTIARFFNYWASKGDYLVVGKLLGAESLGFYSRAYGLMNAPKNILGKVVDTVMFSGFSKIQDDKKRLSESLNKALQLGMVVILPFTISGVILAPEIVYILLGDGWDKVIIPFKILVVGVIFRINTKILASSLKGIGKVNLIAKIQFYYLLLIILGSTIGAYFGGISLVAVCVLAVLIIYFLMYYIAVSFELDYNYEAQSFSLINSLIISCTGAVPMFIAVYYMRVKMFPALLILIIGSIILVGLIWLLQKKRVMRELKPILGKKLV